MSKTKAKNSHRSGESRIYEDLIKGIFDLNVPRIVRSSNTDDDLSNKALTISANTIRQLIKDGYVVARIALK
jgi:hypothetical protein